MKDKHLTISVALSPLMLALLYLIAALILYAFEIDTGVTIKSGLILSLCGLLWIFVYAIFVSAGVSDRRTYRD